MPDLDALGIPLTAPVQSGPFQYATNCSLDRKRILRVEEIDTLSEYVKLYGRTAYK